MATHDYVIANGTGAAVRSDLNGALAAIVSQNSSATEPSPSYAYQRWADTTAGVMKMRNGANNAWITLYQLDGEWSTIAFENGTAAAPSIYFKDSGTDTGIYSPGADQVGISTGGTARIIVDASGNVNIDSNTLYVDAANNRVGIGTSSPGYTLDVNGTIGAGTAGGVAIQLANGTAIRNSAAIANAIYFDTSFGSATHGSFEFRSSNAGTTRMVIDTSGRVGIGTTSPTQKVQITDGTLSNFYIAPGYNSGSGTLLATGGSEYLAFATNGLTNERARIDSSGRFLVGASSTTGNVRAVFSGWGSNPTQQGIVRIQRGSLPTSGQTIADVEFADDSNNLGAGLTAVAEANWASGTSHPSRLVFSTTADGAPSPTERMRISSGGVLSAGGTSTDDNLGSASFSNYNTANAAPTASFNTAASSSGTGNVLIRFWINNFGAGSGMITANGASAAAFGSFSDARLKENIEDLPSQWDKIKSLRPVEFDYIETFGGGHQIGFVAQEMQAVYPDAVGIGDNEMLTVTAWSKTEARLVKALQEAIARIETLEAEVAALKGA